MLCHPPVACSLHFVPGSLAINDEGDWLSFRLGPLPPLRKGIRCAEITGVEIARTTILDGCEQSRSAGEVPKFHAILTRRRPMKYSSTRKAGWQPGLSGFPASIPWPWWREDRWASYESRNRERRFRKGQIHVVSCAMHLRCVLPHRWDRPCR